MLIDEILEAQEAKRRQRGGVAMLFAKSPFQLDKKQIFGEKTNQQYLVSSPLYPLPPPVDEIVCCGNLLMVQLLLTVPQKIPQKMTNCPRLSVGCLPIFAKHLCLLMSLT